MTIIIMIIQPYVLKYKKNASEHLVVKQKPTQIKVLFNNEKNNTD